MTDLWLGMLIAAGAAGAVLVLAVVGLRASGAWTRHRRRFTCPVLGLMVDCELVQDVRTGQWISVERCSALPDPAWIQCDQDCARLLNLGLWRDAAVKPTAAPTA